MKKHLFIAVIATVLSAMPAMGSMVQRTYSPFCFWYWMYGAVSKPAIKADLETMKYAGLRGTYLMPIHGTDRRPEYQGQANQLTPAFWDMVGYSMQQCDSLGLELGIHICDGFALAGGPWFTPEESMQKVVWTEEIVETGNAKSGAKGSKTYGKRGKNPSPYKFRIDAYKGEGYKDIAAFAVPVRYKNDEVKALKMTMSDGVVSDEKNIIRSNAPCSFSFEFPAGTVVRAVEITPSGTNIQNQRLKVEYSLNGKDFSYITTFTPARQGWQNTAAATTFALPEYLKVNGNSPLTLRFSWTPDGTEPGSEDLDAAKWKPTLRLKGIRFFRNPKIHQWEGKAAYAWRVAEGTTEKQVPDDFCPALNDILPLEMESDGTVSLPGNCSGAYRIVRMGHCSTGQTNATAGGGRGLECDKFSKAAVNKLVDNWFCKFMELPHSNTVKYLHVDSWECGCQNWSSNFEKEFMARRGYSIRPWMPLFAGIPVVSASESERVLRDVRLTINELIHDVFFTTVRDRAHEMGMLFSSESIAPTMVADGLDHYRHADLPMGEYWLNSPTHDKPNDMSDAISGAHIYGKNIVQAEGFTEVRGVWDEEPASIKALLDRNFALGMNRLFFHVNTHNPWMDRKPGMTLDGIGLFFQRDQTWMPEAKPFVDYITRCSALLQQGHPVQDIAVYTGDEMPRRSVLPERLVSLLPGIFGKERVASEAERLANAGQPMEISPVGVNHSAGIVDPAKWVNCMRGYQYDSFNPDVLLNLATAKDGCMVLPGGAKYRVVIVPAARPMNPDGIISEEAKAKIEELRNAGVAIVDKIFTDDDFSCYGLQRDAVLPKDIAYTHRSSDNGDTYFIANQKNEDVTFKAVFRDTNNGTPYIYNAVTNTVMPWTTGNISLPANGSCFVLFPKNSVTEMLSCLPDRPETVTETAENCHGNIITLSNPYTLKLREADTTITLDTLKSWTEIEEGNLRYFSGHGKYSTTVKLKKKPSGNETLQLGKVMNIAHVWVNGNDCGIVWTAPYEANIGKALKKGMNFIEIEVVNTWANALRGMDEGKAPYEGIWTNARYRMDKPYLLPAGLLGPVTIK
ncbi:MAG: DNA-binding protein [Bacteroidales bacterium]|nr:DNA-binding protein [Bacteroidales bacterium]MCM1147154.1 DNA-binding protein [Bacteroidales bacterium]MCM1205380.1 DNA-binding protein [Bacillota bacterium]MCM1509815.1 hypothetical protein [Clostridium sp.]